MWHLEGRGGEERGGGEGRGGEEGRGGGEGGGKGGKENCTYCEYGMRDTSLVNAVNAAIHIYVCVRYAHYVHATQVATPPQTITY